jgi:ParB family transcriptional regulator, chromosome partitioning protein
VTQWETFTRLVREGRKPADIADRDVLCAMVEDVAGKTVAAANAKEKGKTLKQIIADHLAGEGGRAKVEHWVPRWLAFPPAAYTQRGGVGSVTAAALVEAVRAERSEPDPETPAPALVPEKLAA